MLVSATAALAHSCSPNLSRHAAQVMSPIELARQSRIAANRAFLAGLNLPASVMSSGQVKPLVNDDAMIIRAARELAQQATYLDAKHQVELFAENQNDSLK